MPEAKGPAWLRAELRRPVERPAIAYREDDSRIGVLISDLSYDGCRLSADKDIQIGENLTLIVMELGAEVAATVKWAASGQVGVQFLWDVEAT